MNQNQTLHWFACVGGDENNANNGGSGSNNNELMSRDNDNDNLPFSLVGGDDNEGITKQTTTTKIMKTIIIE